MENWFITLLCGVIAYGLVFYCFFKAMRWCDKADGFFDRLGWSKMSELLWWLMPWVFLWIVIETVHKFKAFMDWMTS